MLSSIRVISLSAALLAVPAIVFAADMPIEARESLDGLAFQGTTGELGKGEHHEDTITFKNGQFRSLDCEEWGFSPAPYTFTREGEVYRFSATLPSADRGTLEWNGTIKGDVAEASFRWLHERWYWNIDRQYWFKGVVFEPR